METGKSMNDKIPAQIDAGDLAALGSIGGGAKGMMMGGSLAAVGVNIFMAASL
jgi:hypothetical protein